LEYLPKYLNLFKINSENGKRSTGLLGQTRPTAENQPAQAGWQPASLARPKRHGSLASSAGSPPSRGLEGDHGARARTRRRARRRLTDGRGGSRSADRASPPREGYAEQHLAAETARKDGATERGTSHRRRRLRQLRWLRRGGGRGEVLRRERKEE
jgi:hypothetical protein